MSMIFLRFYILCQSFIKSASPVLIVSLVPWVYLLAGEDFVVVTFAYFFLFPVLWDVLQKILPNQHQEIFLLF